MTEMTRRLTLYIILLLAATLPAAAGIRHPGLLFTPEKVAAAKSRIATDPVQAEAWKSIRKTADGFLSKPDVRKMEYPALVYLMTGDRKYSAKLRDLLMETAASESWADREMMMREPQWRSELQMAHRAFQLAMAYDAIYSELTPEERQTIADGLWRLAVEPLLGDWLLEPSRIHSLNSMGHNWWSSCTGMGGLLALAISDENPEAAEGAARVAEALPEWLDFAGDAMQWKPRSFDRAGGMYESINYASFGITEALLFRLAWLNAHPGETLEELPQMERLPEFFAHVSYPREGMLYSINFGDSHKNVTGESSLLLAYEMGVEDPVTLWYATQVEPGQHREGFPRHYPMGFLYTPDLSGAPSTPPLPTSQIWEDFGWATMRDSWEKDATMLAVKSGTTWNHSHADANSMILFHKGVDIIKDAGNCSYGKPEYRNYFFQSEAHNVVRFNGQGQPRYQQYHGTPLPGSLHYLLDGLGVRYVLADGTGPMSHLLDRNLRGFLWIDGVILVIDDLHSHEPGEWEWLWHPGGEAVKQGGDIVVTEGDASVVIRPLYPQPLAPSNFVHDYPEMLYWEETEAPHESMQKTEKYWTFHLPAVTDRVKAVTAIILKGSASQKELPLIKRTQGKDWIGLRIEKGDTVTDIYINQLADGRLMHLNSWIEADGWTTDAYMLAVSYPKGGSAAEPERIFINYGSSLRRGDNVYFSSLSKLNAVYDSGDPDMELEVNGQPRINLTIKAEPETLTVNGKTYPTVAKDGKVTIKIHERQ